MIWVDDFLSSMFEKCSQFILEIFCDVKAKLRKLQHPSVCVAVHEKLKTNEWMFDLIRIDTTENENLRKQVAPANKSYFEVHPKALRISFFGD